MRNFLRNSSGFFLISLVCAVATVTSQTAKAMETVKGLSLANIGLMFIFMCIMGWLAFDAHKDHPSQQGKETLAIYGLWGTSTLLVGIAIATNPDYVWCLNDWYAIASGVLGGLVAVAWAIWQRVGLTEASTKSIFATFCKSVPQLLMAWKITEEGGTGHAPLALLVGVVSVSTRLWMFKRQKDAAGSWESNLLWMAGSETFNLATWLSVCAAWWFYT
jgi:hypothetical protein